MPKKLHRNLLLSAERLGLKGKRKEAYVFGTMRKIEKGEQPKPKRSK